MKRRGELSSSGLEAAPDIMMLTMAGLMVAIVWLTAHAQESTLPPIDLPQSDAAALGLSTRPPLQVTLRPARFSQTGSQADATTASSTDAVEVWIEDRRLAGGVASLEAALRRSGVGVMTLRADAGTRWEAVLEAMSAAAKLEWQVNVAADR